MVRVKFIVEREGFGNGQVWWAAYKREDLYVNGEGSDQHVAIRRGAEPRWLPRPSGKEQYMSRAKGTLIDGEAWIDLEEGTPIRAYAEMAGGLRRAVVKSPVLVVEQGAVWEARSKDGTRSVYVRVEGARPARVEEVE